jgi:hypothetical protein
VNEQQIPDFWVTEISELMGAETFCQRRVQFRGHNPSVTLVATHDLAARARHGHEHKRGLEKLKRSYEDDGYRVKKEWDNKFTTRVGNNSVLTLSGRPDLIAIHDTLPPLIIDYKSGQQRRAHRFQVMMYMLLVPRSLDEYEERKGMFEGRVEYADGSKPTRIMPGEVNDGFIADLGEFVRQLASKEPRPKVPRQEECSSCPLAYGECSERQWVNLYIRKVAAENGPIVTHSTRSA